MTKRTTVPLRKLFDDALSKQNYMVHPNRKKRKEPNGTINQDSSEYKKSNVEIVNKGLLGSIE